jgi:SAM-dependent methyltransferase
MPLSLPRTPEPELMNEAEQARAYAEADFAEPHDQFVARFAAGFPDLDLDGTVLDMGCGPADVTVRFAKAYPRCRVDAIDGAPAMLALGQARIEAAGLAHRIRLIEGYLPGADLPFAAYDAVIANSLLHHLHDPQVLWESIRRHGRPGAAVFVMDLRRPHRLEEADALVKRHAAGEPEILQRDFRHSLHAAYRPGEVRQQLNVAGLAALNVAVISDRHLVVYGRLPALTET